MPTLADRIALWNQYRLPQTSQDLLCAVAANSDKPFSSEAAANAVNRPKQPVGRSLKLLADKGLLDNVSTHGGRFNWKLTAEGERVVSILQDN